MGKIVVPLVVAAVDAPEEVVIPVSRDEAEQAHGGNRGEHGHMVGAIFLDGVDLRPGYQLHRLVPVDSLPAALTPSDLVFLLPRLVLFDACPCLNRVFAALALALVVIPQHFADVGELGPQRAVGVPGSGGSPLAAAGFNVRNIGVDLGVVGLLEFPADQSVFDRLPSCRPSSSSRRGSTSRYSRRPTCSGKSLPTSGSHR